MGTKVNILG
uniref:Uncharacterized protein n=1 Tax=Rhizophora mucronata TaxID=61149 RepID=A0A2P2NF05_RHIMU